MSLLHQMGRRAHYHEAPVLSGRPRKQLRITLKALIKNKFEQVQTSSSPYCLRYRSTQKWQEYSEILEQHLHFCCEQCIVGIFLQILFAGLLNINALSRSDRIKKVSQTRSYPMSFREISSYLYNHSCSRIPPLTSYSKRCFGASAFPLILETIRRGSLNRYGALRTLTRPCFVPAGGLLKTPG